MSPAATGSAVVGSGKGRGDANPNRTEGQMKLGVALPIVDIGGEPGAIRDFVQAAEAIGYQGIAAPDHVLGINVASRPGWTQGRARSTDLYHDPFVLFGFLAGCTRITDFSTQ